MERVEPGPGVAEKKVSLVDFRVNLPKALGILALLGLVLSIGWIAYSFILPKDKPFILNGKQVQLSKEVIAEIIGYERRETEGEIVKYYIKADKAIIFADNHQELENAVIQVYDEKGENFDRISAGKVVFVPNSSDSKLFDAQFSGAVNLESRDGLQVKSELISYSRETENAESTEFIEFRKDNIVGNSLGGIVKIRDREVEMLKDVEINANSTPDLQNDEFAKSRLQSARFKAGYAKVNEASNGDQIIFARESVFINLTPLDSQGDLKQPTDIKADELSAYLFEKKIKRIDLTGNAEVFAKPTHATDEFTRLNASRISAKFEQELEHAVATGNVQIETKRNGNPTRIRSQNAEYDKSSDKFDLRNEVEIVSGEHTQQTIIRSGEAAYQQTIGKINLNGGAEIVRGNDLVKGETVFAQLFPNKKLQSAQAKGNAFLRQVKPDGTTEVSGNEIEASFADNEVAQSAVVRENVYLIQKAPNKTTEIKGNLLTATFNPNGTTKNAVVNQNAYLKETTAEKTTEISGNNLTANFSPNGQPVDAVVRGNGFLKQIAPDKTSEIRGNDLNAKFDGNGQLQFASSIGNSNVVMLPKQSQEFSKATMSAARSISLAYANGILSQLRTDGRTTIKLDAPNNNAKAANRKVTANQVKSVFWSNGKDLARVEAVGDAELVVEPINAAPEVYKTTVYARRFDCDFYEAGNVAKNCSASTRAKAVRVPTIARDNRGIQTLFGDRLNAIFNRQTQDVEQFDAIGNAKFNELDQNGLANQMTFTASDEVIRLRGGEPTIFDSRARAKAVEIDWDTRNQKSYYRGKVGTTYYNQKQTNGATPFTRENKPVYLTADVVQFDHHREVGIYTGNARAWQENNYVRANELVIYQKESRFEGEGKVQSLLYNVARKENGKKTNQPVFVASDKMNYSDRQKHIQYINNVDIRQATDRITGGLADIYLNQNNEMKQTVVQQNVVIVQPSRRATADWVQFTNADEVAVLRGNPATAEDLQTGSTQGSQITISMRDNKMTNEGATKSGGTGRTRTVYRVKN